MAEILGEISSKYLGTTQVLIPDQGALWIVMKH